MSKWHYIDDGLSKRNDRPRKSSLNDLKAEFRASDRRMRDLEVESLRHSIETTDKWQDMLRRQRKRREAQSSPRPPKRLAKIDRQPDNWSHKMLSGTITPQERYYKPMRAPDPTQDVNPYAPLDGQPQEPPPQYMGNPYQQAPPVHSMHRGIAPNMRMPIYDQREGRLWR